MTSHNLEKRITASLRQRLRAASAELRAMVIAETVAWQTPDFECNDGRQAAAQALLHACIDARAIIQGRPTNNALGNDDETPQVPRTSQRWVASERLLALDRAIAAATHAGRLLRQRGLKPTLTTRKRLDPATGEIILASAELDFRQRVFDWRAA